MLHPKNAESLMAWAGSEMDFHGSAGELATKLRGRGLYPLSSNDFWKLRAPTKHVGYDRADEGARWYCVGCLGRWDWGSQGPTRLLVFGQSKLGGIDVDSEGRAFCIFVGQLRAEQDNRFQLMKANLLASKLDQDGLSVTKESLLRAIRDLNGLVGKQFGQDARVVTLRSADPAQHDKWNRHVPVCEHTALSMEGVGQTFKAFVIESCETNTMHERQVDFLQGVLASYMNLDEWTPGLTVTARKRVRELQALRDESVKVQKAAGSAGT